MKTVKLVVAFVFVFLMGCIAGIAWSKFDSNKNPSENTTNATSSKKAVALAEETMFLDCVKRAERTIHENAFEIVFVNGNLMNTVEYVSEHIPTAYDLKQLKHREKDLQETIDRAILKNGSIVNSCSNWGQLPEELAAN
jgi:hypothetical protein